MAMALVSVSASAQNYIAGDVGQSNANFDCTGTTDCKNTATAVKLTGGYGLGNGLAIELGYVNFGKTNAAFGASTIDATATAFTLGAAYEMGLSNGFAVNARAGLATIKSTADANFVGAGASSISQTVTSPYFGLGTTYALTKNVKLRAGADFMRGELADSKYSLRNLSVGARYDF